MKLQLTLRRALVLLVLVPLVALAAVVTAQQIADAVRASPGANQWLVANADAVANLAINVESRGETAAFNGSCCYGVLQMNTENISYYGKGMSPETYRQLSLQDQINMWTRLTVDALQAQAPRTLTSMTTFDGRACVTGEMVLACVQLGIGNCQKMLNSGSCSGFADSNGTTICAMADRMQGSSGGSGAAGGGGGTDGGAFGGGGFTPGGNCIRSVTGACVPITQALEIGFQSGSGVSMSSLKAMIQIITVATVLLIMSGALVSVWNMYSKGTITLPQMLLYIKKGGLIIIIIFMVMTFV